MILAFLRRWWHCLTARPFGSHRTEDVWMHGTLVYIGCECGKSFFGNAEQWRRYLPK